MAKPVFLTWLCILIFSLMFSQHWCIIGPLLVLYWPISGTPPSPPVLCRVAETTLVLTKASGAAIVRHWNWVSVCTLEIKQGHSWDHVLHSSSRCSCRTTRDSPHANPPSSSQTLLCLLLFLLSLPFPPQSNADQVAFQVGGGLSALEQILQVATAASSPTAVPRIPLKWVSSRNTPASVLHADTQI